MFSDMIDSFFSNDKTVQNSCLGTAADKFFDQFSMQLSKTYCKTSGVVDM